MLENISLKNFKGFKELENLNFKPITILCGTNSCGKSSILQSVLLLKQTLESQAPNQILLLNGRFVHLGSFENIVFDKNLDNKLCFKLNFQLTKEDLKSASRGNAMPLRYLLRDLFPKGLLPQTHDFLVSVKVVLRAPKAKSKNKNHIKTIIVEEFQFNLEAVNSDKQKIPGASIDVKLGDNDFYTILWKNLKNRISREESNNEGGVVSAKIKFTSLFSIEPISIGDDSEKIANFPDISFSIYIINNLLQTILSSYSYIGPLREEPSRRYIYEDEITEIGVKGENAAYIYLFN